MAQTITSAKLIQHKSREHTVRQIRSNWYKVTSGETGRIYDVNLGLNGGTCTCEWGRQRPDDDHRSACSHVIAAMNFRATQQGRRVSAWATPEDARRQHRPTLPIGDGVILTSRSN
ncbi:MAG TPA: SWIM zinc finger family protein [Anaerolineae bacterium]|nr:SWIM zinc finger family protein [Anaerolineae bacterium]